MNPYVALPVIAAVNLTLGFVIGKYHERIEWNRLLRHPKPARTAVTWLGTVRK